VRAAMLASRHSTGHGGGRGTGGHTGGASRLAEGSATETIYGLIRDNKHAECIKFLEVELQVCRRGATRLPRVVFPGAHSLTNQTSHPPHDGSPFVENDSQWVWAGPSVKQRSDATARVPRRRASRDDARDAQLDSPAGT
jgi:hypothetical protein